MSIYPIAILSYLVIFAVCVRWATGGLTGSATTATPDEQIGPTH